MNKMSDLDVSMPENEPQPAKTVSLLHRAARYGDSEMARSLLDQGWDVDARDSRGRTPLIVAMINSRAKLVQMLLDAGARIDGEKGRNGTDAIWFASVLRPKASVLQPLFEVLKKQFCSLQLAKKLLEARCRIGTAVYSGDPNVVEHMIKLGGTARYLRGADQFPVHVAVRLHNLEMVRMLLSYGADVETPDGALSSPIFYLHSFSDDNTPDTMDILKLLLAWGVSLTSCTLAGFFQVGPTLIRGSSEAVDLVLQSFIDLSARDEYTEATPLHCLAQNQNPGVAQVLERYMYRMDVNVKDRRGFSPLDLAVSKGNAATVKLLLDQGAKIGDALLYAYTEPQPDLTKLHYQCAEILLSRNADPELIFTVKTQQRVKIIDMAVQDRLFDLIKLALGDLALREKHGATVSETALSNIRSHPPLDKYFNKCKRILAEQISGSVSLFDLLKADTRRMSKYLNNDKLVSKLSRLRNKPKLNTVYKYYYKILKKRMSDGYANKALRKRASQIICEISGDRLSARNIVTEKVVDYFSQEDLQLLCSS